MSAVSELQLRNQLAELRRVGEWVRDFSQAHQLPQSLAQAIDLSLEEWATNIISYAFPDSAEHFIHLRLTLADGEVRAVITDDGREFNPLNHPPVDTTGPLETRAVGGLGIHMMRKLMDRVEYRREGGRNVVTLIKGVGKK